MKSEEKLEVYAPVRVVTLENTPEEKEEPLQILNSVN